MLPYWSHIINKPCQYQSLIYYVLRRIPFSYYKNYLIVFILCIPSKLMTYTSWSFTMVVWDTYPQNGLWSDYRHKYFYFLLHQFFFSVEGYIHISLPLQAYSWGPHPSHDTSIHNVQPNWAFTSWRVTFLGIHCHWNHKYQCTSHPTQFDALCSYFICFP